jgi:ketosteroid isomerase-like protein
MSLLYAVSLVVTVAVTGCATLPNLNEGTKPPENPISVQRAWWSALPGSDTAYLRAHSAPDLTLTLSSGKSFGADSLVRSVATKRHDIAVQWADEHVRYLDENTAVVTSQSTESEGPRSSTYRYTTVIRKGAQGWQVIAAQSTRLNSFTARSKAPAQLVDFEGDYRTPRGLTLKITPYATFMTLREPSGLEVRMESVRALHVIAEPYRLLD